MLAGGAGYDGGEVPERVEQVPAGLLVEPHRAGQAVRHGVGPGAHRVPGPGERDLHGALVLAPPQAGDQAGRLEPLQERGERAVVELQHGGDLLHRLRPLLPQQPHHQVLRVGQPQPVEQVAVQPGDRARGRVQGEAEVVLDRDLRCRRGGHENQRTTSHGKKLSCVQSNWMLLSWLPATPIPKETPWPPLLPPPPPSCSSPPPPSSPRPRPSRPTCSTSARKRAARSWTRCSPARSPSRPWTSSGSPCRAARPAPSPSGSSGPPGPAASCP